MTGFEPRTSGIGSDRSTNWATTTSHWLNFYLTDFETWTYVSCATTTDRKLYLVPGYTQICLLELCQNALKLLPRFDS